MGGYSSLPLELETYLLLIKIPTIKGNATYLT
jgi:hypothetical protein